MKPLEPPASFHLEAAEGWLEMGNPVEANAELDKITPKLWEHPAILKVRWEVYAAAKNWEAALDIASVIIYLEPEEPRGWVYRSYALHESQRTAEARDNLLRVVDKFPLDSTMRYDLACCECQLGRLDQAWLEKAFKLADRKKMKLDALGDPDLEPLRREMKKH